MEVVKVAGAHILAGRQGQEPDWHALQKCGQGRLGQECGG